MNLMKSLVSIILHPFYLSVLNKNYDVVADGIPLRFNSPVYLIFLNCFFIRTIEVTQIIPISTNKLYPRIVVDTTELYISK